MRTTFSEMRLFNDASRKHDTTIIQNGKELGVGKTQRERERERERVKGRVWMEKGCGVGHKLDHWSRGSRDRIIQECIKMNIRFIPIILTVDFSIRYNFSSIQQTNDIPQK